MAAISVIRLKNLGHICIQLSLFVASSFYALSRREHVALALWLATLIATPIVLWSTDESIFPLLASLGVLTHVVVTICMLARAWSLRQLIRAGGVVLIGAWAIEVVGVHTGLPFGDYMYSAMLQPQLGGVPLLIPLAWLMMLPPAWAVAEVILPYQQEESRCQHCPLIWAALAGAAFTAWDLFLDPQMVERGLWKWSAPGEYLGIPLLNFLGWWLAATLLTAVVRPRGIPRAALLLVYTLTCIFQAIGLGIFWEQPVAALCGSVAMGGFALIAWIKEGLSWKRSSGR